MKRILLLIFLGIIQISIAQVRPKFNTVERNFGLSKGGEYKNAITASFSIGSTTFMGDLDNTPSLNGNRQTYNIVANKQISKLISLQARVAYGSLLGDDNTSFSNQFSSDFFSYSASSRFRVSNKKKGKENAKESKVKLYTLLGLGYYQSVVDLRRLNENTTIQHQTVNTVYLPTSLELEIFLSKQVGLMAAADMNYFFTDKLDLTSAFGNWDSFFCSRVGLSFKFE
jgi:hypothetical protein